jgi:hypothetical protein
MRGWDLGRQFFEIRMDKRIDLILSYLRAEFRVLGTSGVK